MERKKVISKDIEYHEMTIDSRIWLLNATPKEIANIINIGYKIYSLNTARETQLQLSIDKCNDTLNEMSKVRYEVDEIKPNQTTVAAGIIGEEYLFTILNDNFKNVRDWHDKAKMGDYIINESLLVEVKNYTNSVPKKEIEKFKRDLGETEMSAGIFISLNSPISNMKSNFKLTSHTINGCEIPVIYLSSNDETTIILSINTLLAMSKKANSETSKKYDDVIIKERIKKIETVMGELVNMKKLINDNEDSHQKLINGLRKSINIMEISIDSNISIIKNEMT